MVFWRVIYLLTPKLTPFETRPMETYKNLCESVEIWGAENNRFSVPYPLTHHMYYNKPNTTTICHVYCSSEALKPTKTKNINSQTSIPLVPQQLFC